MRRIEEIKSMCNLLVIFFLSSTPGCMGYYHHRIENIGNKMLYDVELQCGNQSFSYGYISAGVHKGYSGPIRISKDDKVLITWKDHDEKRYKEVYIDKNTVFKEVVFRINDGDVTVDYEGY